MESLKTILYFSIFRYPLTLEEICNFHPGSDRQEIEAELRSLMARQIISHEGGFYFAGCDPDCIERRRSGNRMAANALEIAKRRAALIAKFPFVEGVGVSGSLSKGYFDQQSDIDFFVVTKPGKVWVSRTLLMLYKKIFLLNSRRYFCINYFISSANLELEEKNRFTATEIRTLIPFQGRAALESFYRKNGWVGDIFGNFAPDLQDIPDIRKPAFSRIAEVALDNRLGKTLDLAFRKATLKFWRIKFRHMPDPDFKVALKSTDAVSKHHPLNFQKRVIFALNEKYDAFNKDYDIQLTREYV